MSTKRFWWVLLLSLYGIAIAEENTHSSGFPIKYDGSKDFPKVFFQDGMFFGESQALQCVEALSLKLQLPVGLISLKHNNSIHGMTKSDALLDTTYRHLDEVWKRNNKQGILVVYMGGATQFARAVQVAKLYGRKYETLRVIPIDGEIAPEQLLNQMNEIRTTGAHPCIKSFEKKDITEVFDDWKSRYGGTPLPSSAQPVAPGDAPQAARP